MIARVSELLDKGAGSDYRRMFDYRCDFVHGRQMDAIPGDERITARRLARRVVDKLIEVAAAGPKPLSREASPGELLTRGLPPRK